MQYEAVTRWIDAYIDAWRSNDPESIAALFTEDATYAYHPWDEPLQGREAIVADWLKEPDEPGSWEAEYRPLLVHDDRSIVTGITRYADGKTYSNLFVIDFDDEGRCPAFTEWYMRHPSGKTAGT